MVLMAGVDLPLRAIREQIASSVNIVVQNSRLADGNRKLLEVVEVVGIENTVIQAQTIFKFEKKWIGSDGKVVGEIIPTGYVPEFMKAIPGSFLEKHSHLFKIPKKKDKHEEEVV
jgi:pilus assembly protein CpaF